MLIMICGDGDFRVNLRKRHRESIRAENLECSSTVDGEKYRGILHAESKWIVNHRRAMPIRVSRASSDSRLNFVHSNYFCHVSLLSFRLYSPFSSSPVFVFPSVSLLALSFSACIFFLESTRRLSQRHRGTLLSSAPSQDRHDILMC